MSTISDDPYITPYLHIIRRRADHVRALEKKLTGGTVGLDDFASGHEYYGLHRRPGGWTFREWAPNAASICMVGTFSGWKERDEYRLKRISPSGTWELELPADAMSHGDLYKLRMQWPGGGGDRLPAYARRVVQDDATKIFSAQVWAPQKPYRWKNESPPRPSAPLIYETHVGMAQEKEGLGTYLEFAENVLPRIVNAGYNTIQVMALMEHPYYGSFGYQVSNFFAASSRFGTPEELKTLIDAAHGRGLYVIMDLVHSHAVKNESEGLSRFDGTLYQYFHEGGRGNHPAWDSRCFDYSKPEVIHFLLSNCRFWLDEYRLDGFRFDGITSMMYHDRGLGKPFTSYDCYFDGNVDDEALAYLALANKVIHSVKPDAITIAEDVSGMPGLAAPIADGGCGFDYRLAMGIPDCWFKFVDEIRDEDWDMGWLWHELINRRGDERTISYAECHDQALVGGKTLIFEMIDAEMYRAMQVSDTSPDVDRGIALHKMIRLITVCAASHGYLNFMGNEFGHPEWIDFPRDGNNWSYHYARRQWRLRDDLNLKYHFLADFDRAMIELVKENCVINGYPNGLVAQSQDKIIIFGRGDMFFFFNFHPSRSLTDYAVEVLPGEYELVLDSDAQLFGGHGRVAPGQRYFAEAVNDGDVLKHFIKIYLPCRCALVLRRIKPRTTLRTRIRTTVSTRAAPKTKIKTRVIRG